MSSKEDFFGASDTNLIYIGIILAGHGIKGEVKVYPLTDFPERYRKLKKVKIRRDGIILSSRKVASAREHGRFWLLKFTDVNTPEEANALKGGEICIPAGERMILPPGHYYFDEILGMAVFSPEEKFYGVITNIIPGAAQDLYVVENKDMQTKFYLPAAKKFVQQVDLSGKRMIVELPAGLLDV